ncbi:MAG: acetyl-CoA acetyltransferase [Deltaproteobacteria bacterium]|nr:acetyl-CoA acetyltransferase [Deltaproteobacteria bacterium]
MDHTPILVGAGQFTERIGTVGYLGLSPVELAAAAAQRALDDAGAAPVAVDAIATVRTFEDSFPGPAPFGKSNNFPRSLARRLGLAPKLAYWEAMGGNTPQQLVNRFAERLARGEVEVVLLAGAEAISTVRHLLARGETRNWAETLDEPVDDRGAGWDELLSPELVAHRLLNIPALYALFENARRARLGQGRDEYRAAMGDLFAPFTRVAAQNPYSAAAVVPQTGAELATPTASNRWIAEPYPLHLVARDQVNQAAALVLTTVAKARALGIPRQKWVFLHGYADLAERDLLDRPDLGAYPAGVAAVRAALAWARVPVERVALFDFYSCFPIAVSAVAQDGLGLAPDDPRGLTVTGGLPYFGGPGNNYAMHAIAEMVVQLRARPGAFGLVGANGGFLSKYSAGVYSTAPAVWNECACADLQRELDAVPAPRRAATPAGAATTETATGVFATGEPDYAAVVARSVADGGRLLARTRPGDVATLRQLLAGEPLGRRIRVEPTAAGHALVLAP